MKLLGSCIYLTFDYLIKSNLEVKNFGKLPNHYNEYKAKGEDFIIDKSEISQYDSNKYIETHNEIILGSYSHVRLKEFVSSQNFESLTKQLEKLLNLIKGSLDQFKGMLWNLEKFQKAKIKKNELMMLKNKFGSLVVSKSKYDDMMRRYIIYESMESKMTS